MWEMFLKGLNGRISVVLSENAMYIQKKNAEIVLPDFIAVAAAPQIHLNSMAKSMMLMILAVKWKEKELSVQS